MAMKIDKTDYNPAAVKLMGYRAFRETFEKDLSRVDPEEAWEKLTGEKAPTKSKRHASAKKEAESDNQQG